MRKAMRVPITDFQQLGWFPASELPTSGRVQVQIIKSSPLAMTQLLFTWEESDSPQDATLESWSTKPRASATWKSPQDVLS